MAIAVFNCHVIPNLFPTVLSSTIWKGIFYTPLMLFVSGGFGVSYFFLLSSFGLCYGNYNKNWKIVLLNLTKRYFRLVPTLFLCDLLAFFLIKNGNYYFTPGNFDGEDIVRFSICQDFGGTIINVIKDAMWNTFRNSSQYVNPFWTIKYEFRGGDFCTNHLFDNKKKIYYYEDYSIIIIIIISDLCTDGGRILLFYRLWNSAYGNICTI